jgi:agmatinase
MKTLGVENNFLALEDEFSNFEKSKIAILSAPYEHTVSYGGGTGFGPEGIINASQFVEFFDEEFNRELCFEKGITTIKPIDFKGKTDKDALDLIEKKVRKLLVQDKFVVTLGGEHTISSAPAKAHFDKYPDMSILHFDAHSDLRDSYEGSKYSHASVMARICEFFDPQKIVQVGIRAQCKEEYEFIKENGIKTFFAHQIKSLTEGKKWQQKVAESLGDEIYVTFDVDYFDPSIMPSTGTPEPNGFLYHETLEVFREIVKAGKRIIGFDVVELAPVKKLPHPDLTTASLIYKMLNYSFANK